MLSWLMGVPGRAHSTWFARVTRQGQAAARRVRRDRADRDRRPGEVPPVGVHVEQGLRLPSVSLATTFALKSFLSGATTAVAVAYGTGPVSLATLGSFRGFRPGPSGTAGKPSSPAFLRPYNDLVRLGECLHDWCRPWSSKPVAGVNNARSGFDSHTLPLICSPEDERAAATTTSVD